MSQQTLLSHPPIVAALTLVVLACFGEGARAQSTPVFETGVRELRSAVASEPKNSGLRLRLARALMRDGPENAHPRDLRAHYEEAEQQLTSILAQDPDNRISAQILCIQRYRQRRYEEVVSLGQGILTRYPTSADTARQTIKALVKLGRGKEAGERFVAWVETGALPSFGSMTGIMSTLCLDDTVRAAIDSGLTAAISRHGNERLHLHAFRAAFLLDQGRSQEAWAVVTAAEKLGLSNFLTGGRHLIAGILLAKGPEPEPGPGSYDGLEIPDLSRLVAENPDHCGLRMRLARRFHRDGKSAEAIAAYSEVIARQPSWWAPHHFLGDLLLDNGKLEDAAKHLAISLDKMPDFVPSRLRLAQALMGLGKAKESVDSLISYASLWPPDSLTAAVLKEAATQNALKVVIDGFKAALAADPENPNLAAHHAEALRAAGRSAEAKAAALDAERFGLAGASGHPADVLYQAFERPIPTDDGR